jgi:hypothetical protein
MRYWVIVYDSLIGVPILLGVHNSNANKPQASAQIRSHAIITKCVAAKLPFPLWVAHVDKTATYYTSFDDVLDSGGELFTQEFDFSDEWPEALGGSTN